MLWTDGVFISQADLERVDAEIAKVAEAESITLTGITGLLRAGIEEASIELLKDTVAFGGYFGVGDLSVSHMAAVLNVGGDSQVRHRASLSQVIVSGESDEAWPLIKRWAIFWTLLVFYRNCTNRTVKDRYESKLRFYKSDLARRVTPQLRGLGIPCVTQPLSRPGALFEHNSGSWGIDNVSLVAGAGTLNGVSRDFAITYVNMGIGKYVSPTSRGNAESHPSERLTLEMTTGNVAHIDTSTLVPPTGVQHPAQALTCRITPMAATHWNVYAGPVGGTLRLQNNTPIAISTTSYTLSGDPTTVGATPGQGQYPDRNLTIVPTRQRA